MPFGAVSRVTKKVAKRLLDTAGYRLVKADYLQQLQDFEREVDSLRRLPTEDLVELARNASESKSQIGQDLFVLSQLRYKRGGYFVEFGATNGIDLSNSYLLEKRFGWTGILAEPAVCWHRALRENRRCHIETRCVWRDSGTTLAFVESDAPELSTIEGYADNDGHRHARQHGRGYSVPTISLLDLLDRYDAPQIVDYLSIDTEGSEYEVLRTFDFNAYRFNVITCEHNFGPTRDAIYKLLTANGYIRRCIGLSRWDDWYVHSDIVR